MKVLMVLVSCVGMFGSQSCRQTQSDLLVERQNDVTQLASSIYSRFNLSANNSANLKISPEGLQQESGVVKLVVTELNRKDFKSLDELVNRMVSSGGFTEKVQVRFLMQLNKTKFVEEEIRIYPTAGGKN